MSFTDGINLFTVQWLKLTNFVAVLVSGFHHLITQLLHLTFLTTLQLSNSRRLVFCCCSQLLLQWQYLQHPLYEHLVLFWICFTQNFLSLLQVKHAIQQERCCSEIYLLTFSQQYISREVMPSITNSNKLAPCGTDSRLCASLINLYLHAKLDRGMM